MTQPTDAEAAELRTFLIADVRGYTAFTAEFGDEAAAQLAAGFARLAREVVTGRGGRVVELRGDEVLAVFGSARQALRAAMDLQDSVTRALPRGIGIGIDAGEAVPVEDGYRGGALNLAARLSSLAQSGETLVSDAVIHLARKVQGLDYVDRGPRTFKGLEEPVHVVEIRRSATDEEKELGSPAEAAGSGPQPPAERQVLPVGGFLGALPDSPLVGRSDEVRRVREAVEAVQRGSGRLILLQGEPGIGKTRLAQETTRLAHEGGFLVGPGSALEQRQMIPFYPFKEALSALYAASPPSVVAEVPDRWPVLSRVLPQLGPAPATDGDEEKEALLRAVADYVQTVAERRPVLLGFDDLHWADDSSLELIRYLAQRARAARVLLVGTYRNVEVDRDHPLQTTLHELYRLGLSEEILVGPMHREDSLALIAATTGPGSVPPTVAEAIYDRAQGNPFYIQEIARSLVEAGTSVDTAQRTVPARVRTVIEGRVGRLSPSAREVLRNASVLGRSFNFDDLVGMRSAYDTASSEETLEAAIDEAVAAHLLREAGRDTYVFQHTLVQQTLYEDIPARRRRRLHLAAADALEGKSARRTESRAGEIAWHLHEAGDLARAASFAVAAGDAAEALFAHGEAERLYRTALQMIWELHASEIGVVQEEAPILEKLAAVLQTVSRYQEALEALERAAQIYGEAGDVAAERRVVAAIGSVYAYLGTVNEGRARVLAVVQRSGGDRLGLGKLYTALALLGLASSRYGEALAAANRAAEIARDLHDDTGLAEAQVRRAEALAQLGRYKEARQVLEETMPLAERGHLDLLARAVNAVGRVAATEGRMEEARAYRERALEMQERLGNRRGMAAVSVDLALDLYVLGDWARAEQIMRRALELIESLEMTGAAGAVRAILGTVLALEGRTEGAQMLEDAVLLTARDGDERYTRDAQAATAEMELLDGRAASARRRLEPLTESGDVHLLSVLARAVLEDGDVPGAEDIAFRAAAGAASSHSRIDFTEALLVQGLVRSRQERWDEADRLFDAALVLAHRMPFPLAEGRILLAWAEMETRRGHPADAEQLLRKAQAIFRRLGAPLYEERAERALAAFALNSQPSTQDVAT